MKIDTAPIIPCPVCVGRPVCEPVGSPTANPSRWRCGVCGTRLHYKFKDRPIVTMEKPRDDMRNHDVFAARQPGGYVLREWIDGWCRPLDADGPDRIVPAAELEARLRELRPVGRTFVQDEHGGYRASGHSSGQAG